jgi:hypothetical protein
VTKRRDLGLRDRQHLGGIGLRELVRFKHLIQRIGQAQLRLTFGGLGKPEIREDVAGPSSDWFSQFSVSACHHPVEALRGLVDAIVLTPGQGDETFQIELRGNLAAMLGATVQTKRSPESDDLSLQLSLVAGACNQRYALTAAA